MTNRKTVCWRRQSQCHALLFWGALVACFWSVSALEAEARPRMLRSGTRAKVYQFAVGPNINLAATGGGSGGVSGYISNLIGGHFSGDSSGFAFGGSFDLLFNGSGGFGFIAGGRLWYDIPIANMSIYVSPFVQPGLAFGAISNSFYIGMDIKLGVEGKVILNNRLVLSLRPIAFDFLLVGFGGASGASFAFNLEFMHFGVGTTF